MIRSLASFRIGARRVHLAPWTALKYFLVSLALILLFVALVDYVILPARLESGDIVILSGEDQAFWKEEGWLIVTNLINRVVADPEYRVWRSPLYNVPRRAAGKCRIMVMGDSFIYGSGLININDSWWRMLERELHHRGYMDTDVIASGFPGATTFNQFLLARDAMREYRPDIVIWSYVSNDPDERSVPKFGYTAEEEAAVLSRLGPDPVLGPLLAATRTIFPRITDRLTDLREKKRLTLGADKSTGYTYSIWERKLLEGVNFKRYKSTLRRVARLMKGRNTPYFFLTLPPQPDVERYRPLFDGVKPAFAEAGIPFYDILDEMKIAIENPNDPLTWALPIDQHPGPRSAHFFAVTAADILEEQFGNLLGPKRQETLPEPPVINDAVPFDMSVTSDGEGVYQVRYPVTDAYMLRWPLNQRYVQFSLKSPAPLSAIRIEGDGLVSAQIFLTAVNEKLGFDNRTVYPLDNLEGPRLTWTMPDDLPGGVNTIRVIATFSTAGAERGFTMELKR